MYLEDLLPTLSGNVDLDINVVKNTNGTEVGMIEFNAGGWSNISDTLKGYEVSRITVESGKKLKIKVVDGE